MMKAALKDQVGRNVLSYVDDIVIVSKMKENYIADLVETLINMREAKFKLNPNKCVFGVTKGKVLRCLISNKVYGSKPRQNQNNYPDVTSTEQKECTEAHRLDHVTKSVQFEASRT
jgi:hypothetical protein